MGYTLPFEIDISKREYTTLNRNWLLQQPMVLKQFTS